MQEFFSHRLKFILLSCDGMMLFAERILRKRRLSVWRKRVETIAVVLVDVGICSFGVVDETIWTEGRSVVVKDLGMEVCPCANAPLPSLKYILSEI
jgi:hypothetical protein